MKYAPAACTLWKEEARRRGFAGLGDDVVIHEGVKPREWVV